MEQKIKEEYINNIKETIAEAQLVLVGIGSDVALTDSNEVRVKLFYDNLASLLKDSNYFVVSENEDAMIFTSGLDQNRITAPFCENEKMGPEGEDLQWNTYMKWLTGTINKRLFIIEIGVLMNKPNVIRWPFERVAMLNEKSHLLRLNTKLPQLPKELSEKGTSIEDNPLYFFESV